MLEVILYSLFIMSASLVGVIVLWQRVGKAIERNLKFLVSLSAGVFVVVALHLSVESVVSATTWQEGLMWVLLGAVVFFLAFYFLPDFHHHHDEEEEKDHRHSTLDARRILFGDGIHNIGDGILLVSATAASSLSGGMVALGIFIHELVQETSEFFVLRGAGFPVKKALLTNFLVSSSILVGSVGGYLLLDSFSAFEAPLLGIAAGAVFVVVLFDLVPHSVRHSNTRTEYLKHIFWFLVGVTIMLSVMEFAGGTHSHEASDGHEDSHEARAH